MIASHSLSCGLAAACAHTCGKDAWTFNAAGLHPNTVERYGEVPVSTNIQAYRHEGEVHTAVQEPNWAGKFARVLLPMLALGPTLGNLVAKKLRQLPAAPGTPRDLPCINEDWDSVDATAWATRCKASTPCCVKLKTNCANKLECSASSP